MLSISSKTNESGTGSGGQIDTGRLSSSEHSPQARTGIEISGTTLPSASSSKSAVARSQAKQLSMQQQKGSLRNHLK
jgi:hypothetical protein